MWILRKIIKVVINNMVFGEEESSSSFTERKYIAAEHAKSPSQNAPTMMSILGNAQDSADASWGHLTPDVQPDADITRIVVDRRMQYVSAHYSAWPEGIVRVALGVILMSTANSIKMQDMVHFLHLAQGSNYLRSHGGQTYLFDNGAFRLFNGVIAESVLQRCSEYASYVEGCLWCIDKKCAVRDEVEIYDSLDRLFRAVTFTTRAEANVSTVTASGDGAPRGVKRPRPPPEWLTVDDADIPRTSESLAEKEIYQALRDYALDKWEGLKGYKGDMLKSWGAQEAVNCQEMAKKLAMHLESAAIIPFYAEYMDIDRAPATGFSMEDVCLVYDPSTSDDRMGRITKQVRKSASCNIYTYVSRPLTERICENAYARVVKFL